MRKFTATSILSTVLLVLFSVTGVATAADEKFYSGVTCQGNDLGYNADGGIQNNDTTSDHWAYCPIVRDTLAYEQISQATVYVYDGHDGDNLYCYLYSRDLEGDLIEWDYDTTTPASDTGADQLYFSNVGEDTANNYYMHFYFRCNIPDVEDSTESIVLSYRATEDNC